LHLSAEKLREISKNMKLFAFSAMASGVTAGLAFEAENLIQHHVLLTVHGQFLARIVIAAFRIQLIGLILLMNAKELSLR